MINKDVEECIKRTMKGINERYNIIIDEIGFDQDHIHIFCGARPNYSPSRITNIIKSITAKQVFRILPKVEKTRIMGWRILE